MESTGESFEGIDVRRDVCDGPPAALKVEARGLDDGATALRGLLDVLAAPFVVPVWPVDLSAVLVEAFGGAESTPNDLRKPFNAV